MQINKNNTIKIMFVCLGNICRSPLALYIFDNLINQKKLSQYFHLNSSGTSSYNIGKKADNRSILIGKKYNLDLSNHLAKQITINDFFTYNYILCMDKNNLSNLKKIQPSNTNCKIHLVTDFNQNNKKSTNIIDPYYLNIEDFESTYQDLLFSLNSFFKYLNKYNQNNYN